MYIARDKNKDLFAYNKKPYRDTDNKFVPKHSKNSRYIQLPNIWFPKITFKNSPKKIIFQNETMIIKI